MGKTKKMSAVLRAYSCSGSRREGDSHGSRRFSVRTSGDAELNGHEGYEGRKQAEGNGRRWFRSLN